MKALLALLLTLAAAATQAQSVGDTAPRSAAPIMPPATPQPGMQVSKPSAKPRPAANLALTVTDDAESLMLPTMASRTVQQPTRLIRVGVEWKF